MISLSVGLARLANMFPDSAPSYLLVWIALKRVVESMNPFGELFYQAKRFLLGALGPATLDEEHDPVEQLQREHEQQAELDVEQASGGEGAGPADRPGA
ncbi:MAG: hypothetical protein ACOYEV_00385 [Candidatus Nanopelagicales bacterium]